MTAKAPHILIVDDSDDIRLPLSRYLRENGLRVSAAANAVSAQKVLQDSFVHLIILDVMMPGEDGFQFCRKLRVESQVPIIFLSARTDEIDRVLGLELGGDDYVCKPFSPRELLARIQSTLRRAEAGSITEPVEVKGKYRFGSWLYIAGKKELSSHQGVVVTLSTMESRVLEAFLLHPGKTLSRFDLIRHLYGENGREVFDRSIDAYVSRLRRKLEKNTDGESYIGTVWNSGYVLSVEVSAS